MKQYKNIIKRTINVECVSRKAGEVFDVEKKTAEIKTLEANKYIEEVKK